MAEYDKKKENRYTRDEQLRATLELERTSFTAHWRDLADYIRPRRARFTVTDVNKGDRRNTKIIDSTATLAARTFRSGMMAGVTSPSRPWFRLTTHDPDLAELPGVKFWLHTVTRRMEDIFGRSNLYRTLPIIYGDLCTFATSAMFLEEDLTGKVIRTTALPIGSYMIATNQHGIVDVIVRDFQMTVRQIVNTFAEKSGDDYVWDNISEHVKNLWLTNQRDTWITVCHLIEPNDEFDPKKLGAAYKRYRSCYYERGVSGNGQNYGSDVKDKDQRLRESGFDRFPVLCPRWEITGEDVYGTDCPGMDALGDIKQLQLGERRIMQAIEKSINPPMNAPTELKNAKASVLPGDITFVNVREGMKGFVPSYQIDPRVQELEAKQEQVRQRIRRTFFEDLFLMLAMDQRQQPATAREIEERHEEKLIGLGPVLEQLNQDLLDPLIDLAFDIMLRQGLIPEAPPELQGQSLKVEYVSIMAQANKLIGLAGMDRLMGFVGEAAKAQVAAGMPPDVLDKVDLDQTTDVYAERLGVDPGVTRSDEQVAEIREARAQAQQQAMLMEKLKTGSETAKNLAGASVEDDNALKRLLDGAKSGKMVAA